MTTPEQRKEYKRQHYLNNKELYLKRNKARKKRLKEEWIRFKSSLSCEMCGESHVSTLDFHHLEKHPSNRQVNKLLSDFNFTAAYKEIERCAVLCANCHRKHHHQERFMKKKKSCKRKLNKTS